VRITHLNAEVARGKRWALYVNVAACSGPLTLGVSCTGCDGRRADATLDLESVQALRALALDLLRLADLLDESQAVAAARVLALE
jgi:hypothetical protein